MGPKTVLVVANVALIVLPIAFLGPVLLNWVVGAHYHPETRTWVQLWRIAWPYAVFIGPLFGFALLARVLARRDLRDEGGA